MRERNEMNIERRDGGVGVLPIPTAFLLLGWEGLIGVYPLAEIFA